MVAVDSRSRLGRPGDPEDNPRSKEPEPPVPPVAVAVFEGSLGVVVVAVAGRPRRWSKTPVAPFAPVTLTLPARAGAAPTASRTSGRAVASSSRRREVRLRLALEPRPLVE